MFGCRQKNNNNNNIERNERVKNVKFSLIWVKGIFFSLKQKGKRSKKTPKVKI